MRCQRGCTWADKTRRGVVARGERTSIPEGEAGGRPVSDSPKEEGGDGGCINAAYAYVIFEEGC